MTDPGSVAAAYAIVLGGLSLYVASILRRLRAARRTRAALQRERERDVQPTAGAPSPAFAPRPSEPSR